MADYVNQLPDILPNTTVIVKRVNTWDPKSPIDPYQPASNLPEKTSAGYEATQAYEYSHESLYFFRVTHFEIRKSIR